MVYEELSWHSHSSFPSIFLFYKANMQLLIVEPRIIGIQIGNLHLVLKFPILSRSWKPCKEPTKRPASVQTITMMRCLLRIVSFCIEVMINQHFRNVWRAAQRPILTSRKFLYFLNFLSIYMSLNSRCISVYGLLWSVSILLFSICGCFCKWSNYQIGFVSLWQLAIAGIKYTGMYSPMHSSNKVWCWNSQLLFLKILIYFWCLTFG